MIAEEIQQRIYTVDEYLELEKRSEVKHEFVDGILIDLGIRLLHRPNRLVRH